MKEIAEYYERGFRTALAKRKEFGGRRIGSELKFPFIKESGYAVDREDVAGLWNFLGGKGWKIRTDPLSGQPVGAETKGEYNSTVARSETGHCLVEFSLAHAADLHDVQTMYDDLESTIREFSDQSGTHMLAFGMHPVERPGKHLLSKKSRNLFWDKLFGSNRIVPEEEGTDVHLFALSAAHQVHIDVAPDEAIRAVNVLNGFAGAQIGLTANSNIWQGGIAEQAQCLGELFWDWWLGDQRDRAGMPGRRFASLSDYADCIADYSPVFIRRGDDVIGLPGYTSFREYFNGGTGPRKGERADGSPVDVQPEEDDISLHNTFFWHDARISRYFTVENRLNDQQPYNEMIVVPALTLGLTENLGEAESFLNQFSWDTLRSLRDKAVHHGFKAGGNGTDVLDHCRAAVDCAKRGLEGRALGEEKYLDPLYERIDAKENPAVRAANYFRENGLEKFLHVQKI
jgi:gamma-glutamylcysteine synthetase